VARRDSSSPLYEDGGRGQGVCLIIFLPSGRGLVGPAVDEWVQVERPQPRRRRGRTTWTRKETPAGWAPCREGEKTRGSRWCSGGGVGEPRSSLYRRLNGGTRWDGRGFAPVAQLIRGPSTRPETARHLPGRRVGWWTACVRSPRPAAGPDRPGRPSGRVDGPAGPGAAIAVGVDGVTGGVGGRLDQRPAQVLGAGERGGEPQQRGTVSGIGPLVTAAAHRYVPLLMTAPSRLPGGVGDELGDEPRRTAAATAGGEGLREGRVAW
jgi:hypothetical protein